LRDYAARIPVVQAEQKSFEDEMLKEISQNLTASYNKRKQISEAYFAKAAKLEEDWLRKIRSQRLKKHNRLLYKSAWKVFNKEADLKR
jgi:lambda family phage tail tape measure protein